MSPARVRARVVLGALASSALFALAACSPAKAGPTPYDAGSDTGDDATVTPPQWRVVVEHLDGALLSVWGTSERDVWTVGGPLGNEGFEALVLRFDGTSWKHVHPGGTATYWWVHGTGPRDVWLVGEKGRITHWDGARFEERVSGTTATLFGVWAAAPDDAWAVGGTPDRPDAPNDVVLHWDGVTWKPEVLPAANKVALFKVWGSSNDDVYVVGDAGLLWHRTKGTWRREAEGVAKGRLTTVTGCSPTSILVVGGRDVLVSSGGSWSRLDTPLLNDVNGVACASADAPPREWGDAVIVGGGSLKLRRVAGAWESDFGAVPFSDLHGAWVDPTGAFWGVGGSFNATPRPGVSREGVVARYGPGVVSDAVAK